MGLNNLNLNELETTPGNSASTGLPGVEVLVPLKPYK